MLSLGISVVLAVAFFVATSLLRPKQSRRVLPPGPEKGPFLVHLLIGNFFSFPRSRLHKAFASWAQDYGTNYFEK